MSEEEKQDSGGFMVVSSIGFFLISGIVMSLGWGLRGYIGGGPYGAMIPGCFVALLLAMVLDFRKETAALVAAFGAIGIGIGGEMTYGQTLGFVREMDTLAWGVLGCTVKGGVWGLLGGAILGLGFSTDKYDRKSIITALAIMVVAFHLGRELINEPKLIYFSNREDRPRDESWAGLLFGAVAFLAYLRSHGGRDAFRIPKSFAIHGLVGGAIGFGVGCLFLAFGPDIKWIGWWKTMEFFFGFSFGGALGLCACRHFAELMANGKKGMAPPETWKPVGAMVAIVATVFASYAVLPEILPEGFFDRNTWGSILVGKGYGLVVNFAFVGSAVLVTALFSSQAAWQAAISLTFFHTVLDYTRDLDDPARFGFVWSTPVQWIVTLVLTIFLGILVTRTLRRKRALYSLLMLAVWSCYATACARSFLNLNFVSAVDGQSYFENLLGAHPSIVFVHGTFTLTALIVTFVRPRWNDEELEID